MTKLVYHRKINPPHVGWWLTKWVNPERYENRTRTYWRWWNGANWSWWAGTKEDPKDLFKLASASTVADPGRIKWCDYWPENARVPRVDPFKASVSESDGQSHQ